MALDADDIAAIGKLIQDSTAAALRPFGDRLDRMDKEAPDVAALIAKAIEDKATAAAEGGKETDSATAARLQDMETKLAAQTAATAKAESARASEKMLSQLRTAIATAGVPAARVDHVVALLHNAQGRIALDDNGNATIRFDRNTTAGAYQDQLALDKGLTEFLDTDAGKAFLPATQVQGSAVHGASHNGAPLAKPGGKPNVPLLQSSLIGAAISAT